MLGLVVIYVVLDFECENTYKSENIMRELYDIRKLPGFKRMVSS